MAISTLDTPMPVGAAGRPIRDWRPLRLLNLYRIGIAAVFLAAFLGTDLHTLGETHPELFLWVNGLYLLFSLAGAAAGHYRWPPFALQARAQAAVDILAVVLLMHASGGIESGLGMLMVPAVAGAGLLLPGRTALLFAALGALALLLHQVYAQLYSVSETTYAQAGLLGAVLFATALTGHALARRSRESEALAVKRGLDLANMAELNSYIVERMDSGIVVIDDEGGIRLINEAAWSLLGRPSAAQSRTLEALSYPLYLLYENWRQSAAVHSPPLKLGHGGHAALEARFTRIGGSAQPAALAQLDDTSEISRAVQATKLASLGRLTASIAHEIRNPLGAISHAAQLLDESPELDPTNKRLVGIIQEQSRRTNTVIQSVLSLSRREPAKQKTVALKPWLADFVEEFGRRQRMPPGWASITVAPEDTTVIIDPDHLQQIVWNLCVNAAKYGLPPGGEPHMDLQGGVSPRSPAPYLDVVDQGAGIAPDIQAQLFEPFFTTDSAGTGLGLYIARELCENNGGSLTHIPGPLSGSCFRIQFPVRRASAQKGEETA